MASVDKAREIVRDDGFTGLYRRSIVLIYKSIIRKISPRVGFYRKNNIKWKEKKTLDSFFNLDYDDPEYEDELIAAVRSCVKSGDYVGVIGGGRGISTAVAAEAAGGEGRVTVYEGGSVRIGWINNTISLNGLESTVDVEHAIVGPAINVYGELDKADQVYPSELPEFDVLEMDCEGAELNILTNLTSKPREIIVEVHPPDSTEEEVTDVLMEMGYEIVDRGLENSDSDQPLPILTAKRKSD